MTFTPHLVAGSATKLRLGRGERNPTKYYRIMADRVSEATRSYIMSRIRGKDTKPELLLRRALHRAGFRYRLHARKLPGTPDIVLPRYRTAIQVRGCFWHTHTCRDGHLPQSREDYWGPKLEANRLRDRRDDRRLRKIGWRVIVVWECQCVTPRKLDAQVERIKRLLT